MIASGLFYGTVMLLLYVSYIDITSLRIPNLAVVAVAACFAPFAVAIQMPVVEFGLHVATGLVVLAVGFLLFSIGLRFGGGDAKLFAALALWCGFKYLLLFFVVMSLTGGGVAVIVFALRQFGIPVWLAAHGWSIPALDIDKGKAFVPYAPAMSLAFVYIGLSGLLHA